MSQQSPAQPSSFYIKEYAAAQDAADTLRRIRKEFLIPTKADLKSKTLPVSQGVERGPSAPTSTDQDECIYLCGNSLGLQTRRTSKRINQYLNTWATQGVFGHFKPLDESPLPTWLDVDEEAAKAIATIVGAEVSEVAVMQTLTANLHFLMSWLYRPEKDGKHKIILESKAFPSDHYAIESQIEHHNLSPSESMITISPNPATSLLTTSQILSTIDEHASTTALIILPGIQFYTGQYLDIPRITAHAHSHNIPIIWDLAHAVGNIDLKLHEWDVDAAVWCSYKYLNAGPGSIGGLFVHEGITSRHAHLRSNGNHEGKLTGWWASSKSTRFAMLNSFDPIKGAGSLQLSNPSVFDITSLCASLEVFSEAGGMTVLREKSIKLTAYLETLLINLKHTHPDDFTIITSTNPEERGAQLSIKLRAGILDRVMEGLVERSVVVDERRPDVIRVAPAPLYNSWADVWAFVEAFGECLDDVSNSGGVQGIQGNSESGVVGKDLAMTT